MIARIKSVCLRLISEGKCEAIDSEANCVQSSNEWLQGIQYFRAFAIIEVIVLHVTLFVLAEGFAPLTPQKEIITAFASSNHSPRPRHGQRYLTLANVGFLIKSDTRRLELVEKLSNRCLVSCPTCGP